MRAATGLSCTAPVAPGPAHPDVVLSQLFNVHAGKVPYTLGWTIVPFKTTVRTYRFGAVGAILALEPATGGVRSATARAPLPSIGNPTPAP